MAGNIGFLHKTKPCLWKMGMSYPMEWGLFSDMTLRVWTQLHSLPNIILVRRKTDFYWTSANNFISIEVYLVLNMK